MSLKHQWNTGITCMMNISAATKFNILNFKFLVQVTWHTLCARGSASMCVGAYVPVAGHFTTCKDDKKDTPVLGPDWQLVLFDRTFPLVSIADIKWGQYRITPKPSFTHSFPGRHTIKPFYHTNGRRRKRSAVSHCTSKHCMIRVGPI